jgi:hypothetical protein
MRKMLALMLLMMGCQKYAQFEEVQKIIYIRDFKSEITRVNLEEWKVGQNRSQVVSKGFLVEVSMTPLEEEHAVRLTELYGINSWIVRILKVDGPRRKEVGYSYIPFFSSNTRTGRSFVEISSITFKINYAAAISGNMRSFKCPAFDHNRLITNGEIQSYDAGIDSIKTTPVFGIQKPVELNQLVPPVFNGGNSLQGKYQVELALYDSAKRKVFGSWAPAKGQVNIEYEKQIGIVGCAGVNQMNW